MLLIIFVIALGVFIYVQAIKPHKYWKEKGVPHLKPWPIFGNLGPTVFRRCAIGDLVNNMYQAFPGQRYFGIYQFFQPTLVIRDPDLIKEITVKEFETFPDHQTFSSHFDPLWSRNLYSLHTIDGWQDMRATLSPLFSSTSIKMMYVLMEKCAQQFTDYFEKQGDTIEVELKDAFTRYTNDVIGTTAFGVTCNSLEDRKNEFYLMGKDATDFSGLRGLKCFGYTISPALMKLLKVNLFSQEVTVYFRRLIKETLKVREEKQIVRPDMFHLLMEAKRNRIQYDNQNQFVNSGFPIVQELEVGENQGNQTVELNDDDITAQALLFFLGGFDTASTLMCYTAYELALNPEVQEKLHEEVQATVDACKGKIHYEALLGMKYLDNVISEALRKWPPGVFSDRKSVKPFLIKLKESGEKSLYLEPGTVCWIPIYSLHRDPNYYPNPERFDPERFSDENKHNIKPYTYLPFGLGPRDCIATQYALLESKLIIVELLRKFEIVSSSKTPIPLELNKTSFNTLPEEGIWVELKKRAL